MPNMDLAKKYEEDLEKLKQEQLEQVESIRVAIKVSWQQSDFSCWPTTTGCCKLSHRL